MEKLISLRELVVYFLFTLVPVILVFFSGSLASGKTLLNKETMNFKTCTKVIETSALKLSSKPILLEEAEDVKIVEFKLEDGSLVITCRGKINELTVHVISK
tara:strand:+ start:300 stop:605 length:306 start_codon:yes stop_codon:yes gene_type:complete